MIENKTCEELLKDDLGKQISNLYYGITYNYVCMLEVHDWIRWNFVIKNKYEDNINRIIELETVLYIVYSLIYENYKCKLNINLREFLNILCSEQDKHKHIFKDYFLDMLKECSSKNIIDNYFLNDLKNKEPIILNLNETIDSNKIHATYVSLSKPLHANSILFEMRPKNIKEWILNNKDWNINKEIKKICELLLNRNIMNDDVLQCNIKDIGLYNDFNKNIWKSENDLNEEEKKFSMKKYLYWTKKTNHNISWIKFTLLILESKFNL